VQSAPNDWPYADESIVCAVCMSEDDRYVTVETVRSPRPLAVRFFD
jgi:hypothetical protein